MIETSIWRHFCEGPRGWRHLCNGPQTPMSFALNICVPIISAHNLGDISGHATRIKKRNALQVRPVGQALYLAEPKGLIRYPYIYEKVESFRRQGQHHLGAVIAPPIAHAKLNSTARVSKRPSHRSSACLRARYCTNLVWLDLARRARR